MSEQEGTACNATRRDVADWARAAGGLSAEEFAAAHPHPFLVQERVLADDDGSAAEQFATLDGSAESVDLDALLGTSDLGSLEVQVVVKRTSGLFEGMVGVGRTENNDVSLPHAKISKFHAFFIQDPTDGTYAVVDADSTNGTTVNEERLAAHERQPLQPRDLVAFGGPCSFRFHTPETFHELLRLAG